MRAAAYAIILAGCGAPLAKTPKDLPERAPPASDAEVHVLDERTLTVEAEVKALTTHTLHFKRTRGRLAYSPSNPTASSVEVEVDAESATATIGGVAEVAKYDFLDASVHKHAGFVSRVLRREGDAFVLIGVLSIRGKARPVELPLTLVEKGCDLRFSVEFRVHRQDFGVVAQDAKLDGVVSDDLTVRAEGHVLRKKTGCPDP